MSGNDMLLWFESDAAPKLALLYLESFGTQRRPTHVSRPARADVLVARQRALPGMMTWAGGGSAYSSSISAERFFSTCRWLT